MVFLLNENSTPLEPSHASSLEWFCHQPWDTQELLGFTRGPKWRYGAPFLMAEHIFGLPWGWNFTPNKWSYLTLPKTTRGPPEYRKFKENIRFFGGFKAESRDVFGFFARGVKELRLNHCFLHKKMDVFCVFLVSSCLKKWRSKTPRWLFKKSPGWWKYKDQKMAPMISYWNSHYLGCGPTVTTRTLLILNRKSQAKPLLHASWRAHNIYRI